MIIIRTFSWAFPVSWMIRLESTDAREFGILFRMYLPLSKPVMATVSLFYAVGYWNTFSRAVLFIRDRRNGRFK